MFIEIVALVTWFIIGVIGRYCLWFSSTEDLKVADIISIFCCGFFGIFVWVYYLFIYDKPHGDIVVVKRRKIIKGR